MIYQQTLFDLFCRLKLYPLAGVYSVNQSNLIFAPRRKIALAVRVAVNYNESMVGFTV